MADASGAFMVLDPPNSGVSSLCALRGKPCRCNTTVDGRA
jgi:hypothetical protein